MVVRNDPSGTTGVPSGLATSVSEYHVVPFLWDLAEHIGEEVCPRNPSGFTFSPWSWGEPRFNADDYVVSLANAELCTREMPTSGRIFIWLQRVWRELMLPGRTIGGWLNPADGHYYLDINRTVRGERAAIILGRRERQQAIYHPTTGQCLPVVWPTKRVA